MMNQEVQVGDVYLTPLGKLLYIKEVTVIGTALCIDIRVNAQAIYYADLIKTCTLVGTSYAEP